MSFFSSFFFGLFKQTEYIRIGLRNEFMKEINSYLSAALTLYKISINECHNLSARSFIYVHRLHRSICT